eukprot:6468159-Amphidinium_carterae.11
MNGKNTSWAPLYWFCSSCKLQSKPNVNDNIVVSGHVNMPATSNMSKPGQRIKAHEDPSNLIMLIQNSHFCDTSLFACSSTQRRDSKAASPQQSLVLGPR